MSTMTASSRPDATLRWTFALAMLALLLLSAADVAATGYGLANGAQEANRLVRMLIGHSGLAGFAAVKLTTTGAEAGIFLAAYLISPGRWRWLAVAAVIVADLWLLVLVGHDLMTLFLSPALMI